MGVAGTGGKCSPRRRKCCTEGTVWDYKSQELVSCRRRKRSGNPSSRTVSTWRAREAAKAVGATQCQCSQCLGSRLLYLPETTEPEGPNELWERIFEARMSVALHETAATMFRAAAVAFGDRRRQPDHESFFLTCSGCAKMKHQ